MEQRVKLRMNKFHRDEFPDRPRILFVGLAESTHTHSWIDLLEKDGFNVRFFALPSGIPPNDWKVKTYITQSLVGGCGPDEYRHRFRPDQGFLLNRIQSLVMRRMEHKVGSWEKKWLNQVIQQWKPDVIHTLGLDPASFLFSQWIKNIECKSFKWVVTARGGPELALNRQLLVEQARIRMVLSECDFFIADNELNYQYATELGLNPKKCASIGFVPGTGGVDVDSINKLRKEKPSTQRTIVWPKAYECPASKALPVLEAFKLCWDKIQPVKIIMTAMIPETRMWLANQPQEIRNACVTLDRVPREEMLTMFASARVVLMPSLTDGIPNTLYEAMAAGALPIVSPLETITPLVEQKINVLYARNLYPHEIADALVYAMSDDRLVDEVAERNLVRVREIAEREMIRIKVTRFYHELSKQALCSQMSA